MIHYIKSNLVYIHVFPQFKIFQKHNNTAQTSVLIFFTSRHYYYVFEKFKIVEKQVCKLSFSYGKVSHTLKTIKITQF